MTTTQSQALDARGLSLELRGVEAAAEAFEQANPDLGDYVRLQLAISAYLRTVPTGEAGEPVASPDLITVAQRILDRGYISESIEEERADYLALVEALTSTPPELSTLQAELDEARRANTALREASIRNGNARYALEAHLRQVEEALRDAADTLESLSYIHDGNPSDAMADMPPVDYARHMLFEARQMAKAAHAEARAALSSPAPAEDADVAELVVAARIVAFESPSPEALRRLGQASEAFANRVPWDDEPHSGANRDRLLSDLRRVTTSPAGREAEESPAPIPAPQPRPVVTEAMTWEWRPYPTITENQRLYDVLVVGSVQRFYEDAPTYASAMGKRLGAISTDAKARTAVEKAALAALQQADAQGWRPISPDEAEVIRAFMEEFYVKGQLEPDETRVFLNICSRFDFGRPVPCTGPEDTPSPSAKEEGL